MVKEDKKKKEGLLKGAIASLKKTKDLLEGATSEEEVEETEAIEEEVEEEEVEETSSTEEEVEGEVEEEEVLETKSILKRLDALEQKEYKQEKVIKELKEENKRLKQTSQKKEYNNLVKEALAHSKDLKKEKVKDEETLLKEMEKHFTPEEIEADKEGCIKQYIKGLVIAKSEIPEGKIAFTGDNHLHKESDKNKARAEKLRKDLENRGKVTPDEGEE